MIAAGGAPRKIRVLVIDDSAVVRRLLSEILSQDGGIEVVGTAGDPFIARDKIKQLNPDVLTLDVEMPRMDGLTFLRNLMRLRPTPVVMVSSLTAAGADVTLEALEIGAADFVTKPKVDVSHQLTEYAEELIAKVKQAAGIAVRPREAKRPVAPKLSADAIVERDPRPRLYKTTDRVIAIGASTGGTEAIREVLEGFPADAPGTVVTQHFPDGFSEPYARRLDQLLNVRVCVPSDGQQILAGHVYIAPGAKHLMVERSGARYVCKLHDGPPVNRHRPAVDVMFRTLAHCAGPNVVAALLTGMGDDGARGLRELREAGAATIAQDQASSVVWGMPGAAVKLDAAQEVIPLAQVAARLLRRAND